MKKLTKKVGGQRMMKTIEAWYGLNKSTPDAWFDRWEVFINHLLEELGFKYESCSVLEKPRGSQWTKEMSYTHQNFGLTHIVLKRKRRQEAGLVSIYMFSKTYRYDIETGITPVGYQYKVMSRQDLGDKIIVSIRQSWERHLNETHEKS